MPDVLRPVFWLPLTSQMRVSGRAWQHKHESSLNQVHMRKSCTLVRGGYEKELESCLCTWAAVLLDQCHLDSPTETKEANSVFKENNALTL